MWSDRGESVREGHCRGQPEPRQGLLGKAGHLVLRASTFLQGLRECDPGRLLIGCAEGRVSVLTSWRLCEWTRPSLGHNREKDDEMSG